MASKVISKLSILVGATADELKAELRAATKEVDKFDRKTKAASPGLSDLGKVASGVQDRMRGFVQFLKRTALQLGAMVAAAALAKVSIGGILQGFQEVDRIAKFSDEVGLSTNELLAFRLGAELTGTDLATLEKGLQRFVRRLGEAREGLGQGRLGFAQLGIDVDRLVQMRPAEAMRVVAEAISQLPTPAEKAAAAYRLFGRQGQELLTFLNAGAAGIDQFVAEAERLGLTFSRETAADVEVANDAITLLNASVSGLSNKLTIALAPSITKVATNLTEMVSSIGSVDASTVKSVVQIGTFVTTLGLVITVAPRVIAAIRAVIVTLRSLTVASVLAQGATGAGLVKALAGLAVAAGAAFAVGAAFDELTKDTERAASAADEIKPVEISASVDGDDLPDPDEIDDISDATKRAREETEKWARVGERLTERFKSPFEQLIDKVAEAREALRRGRISWEIYQSAVDDATAAFERQNQSVPGAPSYDSPRVGAAVGGTSSGLDAIEQSRTATINLANAIKTRAARDEARNKLLQRIETRLADVNNSVQDGRVSVTQNSI